MLKNLVLASVTALGLAIPFTATPAADAAYHHHRCYEVLVRGCDREPWVLHGSYESHHRAEEIAHHLRRHGLEVRIVERI